MTTTLDNAIREHIYRFLAGDLELQAFEDWFVSAVWDVVGEANPNLTALIGSVELALAEYTSGHATIIDLREDLGDAMHTVAITISDGGSTTTTSDDNTFINQQVTMPAAVTVLRSVVASL